MGTLPMYAWTLVLVGLTGTVATICVMLFRGAERNRRRGFHNLQIFYQKVRRLTEDPSVRLMLA